MILQKKSKLRRYLIVLASFALGIVVLLTWYKARYSMEIVTPYEVNSDTLQIKVLIATQGSVFKDNVVEQVITSLKPKEVHIKVIDVSSLANVREGEWSAILVLHTWEYSKPQMDVDNFVKNLKMKNKLIVVTTSGSGMEKIEGIDAISSASKRDEVAIICDLILERIDQLIGPDLRVLSGETKRVH